VAEESDSSATFDSQAEEGCQVTQLEENGVDWATTATAARDLTVAKSQQLPDVDQEQRHGE
jgi:hypothetical protein